VRFNDRFENLTIFDVFLLEIPEIGNAHAGEAHKTKEVSCPSPLGRFKLKIQQGHQFFKGQINNILLALNRLKFLVGKILDIATFLAPGEECFQVADDFGKVIILGFPFTKRIGPEVVKELKVDRMEIDFVFSVLFEIQ
jgi:hypothetical protein